MIPFPPDHPATRIRNLPRPSDHDGYGDVEPTLQVHASTVEDPAPASVEEAVKVYPSLREEVLDTVGAFEDGWSDEHDLLYCPDGFAVEDDGECPDGHISPLRAAGLI